MAEIDTGSLKTAVEFNVLGPVTVADGAESLNIGGPKQRTVLAMLIAHHGRPVSNDAIASAVYGDDASSRNRRNVQTYVSTLRSIIGDVIVREGSGWSLDVERSQVDAVRFEDLYESIRSGDDTSPVARARLLREALALWRGLPYHDIESHGRLGSEVARLNELRVAVQAVRIDADLESGRHADLIGEIEGHISEHPYSERFRAQHMLALYRAGRQREALRSYEDMRALLVEELGVEPTPDLQTLEQRILEQDEQLDISSRRQIQRKAILVADPGDPIELARLPMTDRHELLSSATKALKKAVGGKSDGRLIPAGVATYAVFDDVADAASAAEEVTLRLDGTRLRIAIDFGDVEVSDDAVSGAPVSRAAVLVSVAHRGQVLLSSEAQQAVVFDGDGAGLRFESLGKHELAGIQEPSPVYQLLVGNPPTTFPPLETDQVPVPLPEGGDRSVPGYELREPIGAGSVGTLYRGYQPSVGREVMVEVIGRAESSDTDFIRHFEADAQRLSLLDHPNINPLLDYWRDTEGAYLVYRYHRGGFVHVPASEVVRQVASALAYAHSYGLVHGSVRPDRVILDESGNGYLLGFPIAGVEPVSSPDYSAYIAPEVLAGEPPSVATDVFGLGVLAHESESGPVAGDVAVEPDTAAIRKAIAEDPGHRPTSVAEFIRDWGPETDHASSRFTETRNPYKGLAAFYESDADDFFGRDADVADLVEAVANRRLIAVVGPSGVGKSSVVRAGLIPALRRGAVEGSDLWVITDMLPGPRPFIELQRALERVAVALPPGIRNGLAGRDANSLASVGSAVPAGSDLLVVVDQFEELFTMSSDDAASAFLDLIRTASEMNQARFVITLRADFLDRPLLFSEFGELLRGSMIVLRAPSELELADSVQLPARGVGVDLDPALTERIVSEVHDRPGALPLLQHALVELFEARTTDLIALGDYEGVGGVTGSLARRAEDIYAGLDEAARPIAKQLFLRLVTVVEDAAPTRRRVRFTDLEHLAAEDTIDLFVWHRLLVQDTDPDTRSPTVEVAHEALLSHWPRLAGWIGTAREDLTLSRRLDEAIRDWEASGDDDAYLLTGGRLAQHRAWTTNTSLALTDREAGFLERSTKREQLTRQRTRRRRRAVVAGFAIAALIATGFGIFGLRQADNAGTNAQVARSRELAAASVSVLGENPELSTMLALQSIEATPEGTGPSVEGISALRQALLGNRLIKRIPVPESLHSAVLSSDGNTIYRTSFDEQAVYAVDVESGYELWSYTGPPTVDTFHSLTISPDDDLVAVAIFDDVRVLGAGPDDLPSRVVVLRADDGEVERMFSYQERVCCPGFSRNGRFLTVPHEDEAQPLIVYDTETWETVQLFADRSFTAVEFNADGDRALVSSPFEDGDVVLLSYPDGEEIQNFGWAEWAILSPDGETVALGMRQADDFRPQLVEATTGERIAFLDAVDAFASRAPMSFSPDGSKVAYTTRGRDFVFDAGNGRLIAELGEPVFTWSHWFPADSSRLLTAQNVDLLVWDLGSGGTELMVDGSDLAGIDHNAVIDGPSVAVEVFGESQAHIAVVDPADGRVIANLQGWKGVQLNDGEFALIQEEGEADELFTGLVALWDPETGQVVEVDGCLVPDSALTGVDEASCSNGEPVYIGLEVTSDGAFLIGLAYSPDDTPAIIRVWDTRDLSLVSEFEGPPQSEILRFEVAGKDWVAFRTDNGTVTGYDLMTGDLIGVVDAPVGGFEPTMSLSPDGSTLLAVLVNSVYLIDTVDWEIVGWWEAHSSQILGFAWSPDGNRLVTTGEDDLVKVWDVSEFKPGEDQEPLLVDRIPAPRPVDAVFLGDDRLGLFLSDGARWLDVPLAIGDLVAEARSRLTRGFLTSECTNYDMDPCPTLDEMRAG